MRLRPRASGPVALLLAATLAAACSGGGGRPGPDDTGSPEPVPTGPGSAAAARERLCTRPEPLPPSSAPIEGETPAYVRTVMDVIEELRGLTFSEPVVPEPIERVDLDARIEDGFDAMYPRELYERRGLAWQTMGAIPKGTDLREAYHRFYNVAVLGYYDTLTGELVFLGTDDPMPEERVTLAHELVHALEDQRFDLSRIDRLLADCQDEAFQAALAVVEGSATYHMVAYADAALTPEERATLGGGAPQPRVPQFLLDQMAWPYRAGYAWAQQIVPRGDLDAALTTFPTTTEQILHPDRAGDMPTPVDVPDLGPALGTGWSDLDVQDVGESWLWSLLARRVPMLDVDRGTEGWDGGLARSWTDGERVAVVLATVWDTSQDADEFADIAERYVEGRPILVVPDPGAPRWVRVLFASDAATLDLLRSAVG